MTSTRFGKEYLGLFVTVPSLIRLSNQGFLPVFRDLSLFGELYQ